LLTLREHVIAPILAGIRSPRMGRSAGAVGRDRGITGWTARYYAG